MEDSTTTTADNSTLEPSQKVREEHVEEMASPLFSSQQEQPPPIELTSTTATTTKDGDETEPDVPIMETTSTTATATATTTMEQEPTAPENKTTTTLTREVVDVDAAAASPPPLPAVAPEECQPPQQEEKNEPQQHTASTIRARVRTHYCQTNRRPSDHNDDGGNSSIQGGRQKRGATATASGWTRMTRSGRRGHCYSGGDCGRRTNPTTATPSPTSSGSAAKTAAAPPAPPRAGSDDRPWIGHATNVRLDILFSFGLLTSSEKPYLDNYMDAVEQVVQQTLEHAKQQQQQQQHNKSRSNHKLDTLLADHVHYDPRFGLFVQECTLDTTYLDPHPNVRPILVIAVIPIFLTNSTSIKQDRQGICAGLQTSMQNGQFIATVKRATTPSSSLSTTSTTSTSNHNNNKKNNPVGQHNHNTSTRSSRRGDETVVHVQPPCHKCHHSNHHNDFLARFRRTEPGPSKKPSTHTHIHTTIFVVSDRTLAPGTATFFQILDNSSQTLTIFGPSNAAMALFGDEKVQFLVDNAPILERVIRYHIVDGNAIDARRLARLDEIQTAAQDGQFIRVQTTTTTTMSNNLSSTTALSLVPVVIN